MLHASEFVELLANLSPQTRSIVDDHLREYENELLLHLLVADIRRFCVERFDADDSDALNPCLEVVALGLADGDEHVEQAVAVSFVEDTGWWDRKMKPFIAAWPKPLREEAKRQQARH